MGNYPVSCSRGKQIPVSALESQPIKRCNAALPSNYHISRFVFELSICPIKFSSTRLYASASILWLNISPRNNFARTMYRSGLTVVSVSNFNEA